MKRGHYAALSFLVIAFWAVMTGWLLKRFADRPETPRATSAFSTEPREVWFGVYLADETPAGFLGMASRPEERDGRLGQLVHLEGRFALELLSRAIDLEVDGNVWRTPGTPKAGTPEAGTPEAGASETAQGPTTELEFRMRTGDGETRFRGTLEDGRLRALVSTGGEERPLTLPVDENALLSAGFGTALALPPLEPGQRVEIGTLDPLSLSVGRAVLECVGREEIVVAGETHDALRVDLETAGLRSRAWVDEAGEVLRAETPLGLNLQRISRQEAEQLRRSAAATAGEGNGALLESTAVRPSGLRPRRGASLLRLRAHGVALPEGFPEDDFQRAAGDGVLLIHSDGPGGATHDGVGADEALTHHLRSETFVQASAPTIRQQAAAIVGGESDPWQRALRLHHWVYEEIEKVPVLSLPSALDVLERRTGDCNEHTVLYVALARAAGVPSRIAIGLVWSEDSDGFYYHAWPEVAVDGRWIWLDPTLGQPVADATHIKLLTGGIETWSRLLPYLGRLEIEVLEVQ